MGVIYHGSSVHGLKKIETKESTHGKYVYATKDKLLAAHFSKRSGDDLVYDIDKYSDGDIYSVVELVPWALEKMYNNSASIYTVSDETFENIETGFDEMVSSKTVDVIDEEVIDDLYSKIMNMKDEGLLKIYRYPLKPEGYSNNIITKYRHYIINLHKQFEKEQFDRIIYLHPELMDDLNKLLKEVGYDYSYKVEDIPSIFKDRVNMQINDFSHEQYVECAYEMIRSTYPEITRQIDSIYEEYNERINVYGETSKIY